MPLLNDPLPTSSFALGYRKMTPTTEMTEGKDMTQYIQLHLLTAYARPLNRDDQGR